MNRSQWFFIIIILVIVLLAISVLWIVDVNCGANVNFD